MSPYVKVGHKCAVTVPQELHSITGDTQVVADEQRCGKPFLRCEQVFDRLQPGELRLLALQGEFELLIRVVKPTDDGHLEMPAEQ